MMALSIQEEIQRNLLARDMNGGEMVLQEVRKVHGTIHKPEKGIIPIFLILPL
jgi:hypothetical protein